MSVSTFDEVVASATRSAILLVSPHELPVLEDILTPPRRRLLSDSDAIGFGVGELTDWIAPFGVAALTWYARIWYTTGKSEIEKRTRKWITRRFAATGAEEPSPPTPVAHPLSPAQLAAHAEEVTRFAVALGLDKRRAKVLGKAVVGSVIEKLTADTKS